MFNEELTDYIAITNTRTNEFVYLNQNNVKIREGQNKIMALSYKAPLFDTIEIEDFFNSLIASEKLKINIGGTGNFYVSYRGLIDGNEKNFSKNIDHKIILLEESKCPPKGVYLNVKRYSKFMPRGKFSE